MNLNLIKRWAAKSDHSLHHHVSVVMRGGSVVSIATNVGWTHAERAALGKIWMNQRKGLRLYSYRVGKSGALRYAKPCDDCMELIRASGIRSIYYSLDDGTIAQERVRGLPE